MLPELCQRAPTQTRHEQCGNAAGSGLSKIRTLLLSAPLLLLAPTLHADDTFKFSTKAPDSRTMSVQRKVDELFESGEFERAYFIYRNELVPAGDKYAQYMVGFMHLMGMGVEEDSVVASAWYRLAAERGTPEFVAVRDQLMHDLEDHERRRSDMLYMDLRREYHDLAVLLSSIKRKLRQLGPVTGSRLGSQSGSVTVVDSGLSHTGRSSSDYTRVHRQLQQDLVTLAKLGEFSSLETDPAKIDIDEIERLVTERIESAAD